MHYVIFAIVPKDVQGEDETKSYIEKMMLPFSETTEDPQYATEKEDGYLHNPNGHWDWYRVGGRWDGELIDNYQSSDNGFNWDDKHQTVSNNRVPVAGWKSSSEFGAFGIVFEQDGKPQWADRYLPSWTSKELPVWEAELSEIMGKLTEHDIVVLDVHS